MKLSIILTIFILVAAAGLGWRNSERLEGVRSRHKLATAAAAQVGVSIDVEDEKHPIRVDRRNRLDRNAVAKQLAAEIISIFKKYPKFDFEKIEPADRTKFMELWERMSSLNAAQVGIFIAAMQAATDLDEQARSSFVHWAIINLSERDPQAALELFQALPEAMKTNQMSLDTNRNIFENWAKINPEQTMRWMKANEEKFPELVHDASKKSLLRGMASTDPKKAFQAISELGVKNVEDVVTNIIHQAKTEEQRTQIFAALREYLGKVPDEKARKELMESTMRSLGSGIAGQGFEAGTRWITAVKPTPEEIDGLIENVTYNIKRGEQPKWIEWIGKQLPPEKADMQIHNIVNYWTRNNYQAVGTWLSAAPTGPTKNTAIRSYAETISEVDPETAAQWAMTLPAGKEREQTMRNIHDNWPSKTPEDEAAAKAFAEQHGIRK